MQDSRLAAGVTRFSDPSLISRAKPVEALIQLRRRRSATRSELGVTISVGRNEQGTEIAVSTPTERVCPMATTLGALTQ